MSTVIAAALMAVLLACAGIGLAVGKAVAEHHRVDGAADLVALSSAAAVQRGNEACAAAEDVALANHVRLVECQVQGADVVVRVENSVSLVFGISARMVGRARAGP